MNLRLHHALLPILLIVNTLLAEDDYRFRFSDEVWLRDGIAKASANLEKVTQVPHPKDNSIVALNCEYQEQWNGRPRVIHRTGDRVDWVAEFPVEFRDLYNGYVVSLRWVYLRGPDIWALELFDSSHRGNGSITLFALEERKLRILMHERAVDRDRGGGQWQTTQIFEGGMLRADYGEDWAELSGKVQIVDNESEELRLIGYYPVYGLWKWDTGSRVFKLDPEHALPNAAFPSLILKGGPLDTSATSSD